MKNYLKDELKERRKLLSPKLDVVFQALFGEVGSENITSKLLEAILKRPIKSIDLNKNPILRREYIDDKLGILDMIAYINNKEYSNIEMQVAEQDKIKERIIYYWGREYTKQLKKGKKYDKLQKVIVILIADFEVKGLEELEYHTTWKIIEEKYRQTILTEMLEIRIIEIPKVEKKYKKDEEKKKGKVEEMEENDELMEWLMFINNPEDKRLLKKMRTNKELREAKEKLGKLSQDEHMRKIAEWREKAIYEENTARSCRISRTVWKKE